MEWIAERLSGVIWYWRFQRKGEEGGSISCSSKIFTVRSMEQVAMIWPCSGGAQITCDGDVRLRFWEMGKLRDLGDGGIVGTEGAEENPVSIITALVEDFERLVGRNSCHAFAVKVLKTRT